MAHPSAPPESRLGLRRRPGAPEATWRPDVRLARWYRGLPEADDRNRAIRLGFVLFVLGRLTRDPRPGRLEVRALERLGPNLEAPAVADQPPAGPTVPAAGASFPGGLAWFIPVAALVTLGGIVFLAVSRRRPPGAPEPT